MNGGQFRRLGFFLFLAVTTGLAACSGGGGGGGGGGEGSSGGSPAAGTTTVSGNVALSAFAAPSASFLSRFFSSRSPISGATVELFDADHPEWLYPVAIALTDASGNYTLSTLTNGASNGSAYTNGAAIPTGNYTAIGNKFDSLNGKLYVGVQAYVKRFDGPVTGNNLEAVDSGATPKVLTMLGLPDNTTNVFGGPTHEIPSNGAIQITFNTPMARLSVVSATTLRTAGGSIVNGAWKLSADLVSALFYPASGALVPGDIYTVTVLGGADANAARNLFNTKIPSNVTGIFKAATADSTSPNAIYCGGQTNVSITSPLLIASNEPLDTIAVAVTSNPSIGARPTVLFKGSVTGCATYSYGYEIVPSGPLLLNTDYTITVGGAKDIAGNTLASLNFNFKTETNHAPVSVLSTSPASGATGTALTPVVTANFSGTIRPESVTATSFSLSGGGATVPGAVSATGSTATFVPNNPLAPSTVYTATITSGIQDQSGLGVASYTWTFTTRAISTAGTWDSSNWDSTALWGN